MYVEGRQRLDHVLHVKAPFEAWKIYCALPSKARAELPVGEGRFEAQDYDHLVDCPIEMGDHQEFDFKACGALHRVVLVGRNQAPVERLKVDLPKLVKATKELFGELPYKRYLTLVMHTEEGRGGLEHRDSTALVFPRDHYATEEGYEDFLCLWCHEHFHAWNVKRIRPTVLGPFDYTREAYTRALWAMEGITSYYENPLMVRAGLMTPMRALELFGRRIGTLLQTPGRRLHSLEEASFDAWIKYYRPDESTQNTTVSYYLKGELVACLLDLELRVRTGGERSLDDVMRELWRRYQASGEGFVEEHLQGLIEEVAGGSLQGFFDAYLRGVEEPPWEECFARVGLRFEPADHDPAKPYLGVNQREVGDTLWVESVKAGSAAEQAGVSPGDELVALDGKKLDRRSLPRLLAGIKPGHEVDLHVFRLGVLRCIRVRFGSALVERYALRPDPDASPQTFALARGWLGVERKKKS
jgi:predicted metalloprotease with PDZ domain